MAKGRKQPMEVPSDPERTKIPTRNFLEMLRGSREKEDFVLVEYGDGALELLTPKDITTIKIKPRSSMPEMYEGKSCLESGMPLRLRWNADYDRCEAVVKAVGKEYGPLSALFDEIMASRSETQKRQKYSKLRKGLAKTAAQRNFERAKQRAEMADQYASGSIQAVSEDIVDNAVDMIDLNTTPRSPSVGKEENSSIGSAAPTSTKNRQKRALGENRETEDSSSVVVPPGHKHTKQDCDGIASIAFQPAERQAEEGEESVEEIQRKLEKYQRKVKVYKDKLAEKGISGKQRTALVVPDVNWAFDMDKDEVDKTLYARLEKGSNIWVSKQKLKQIQKDSKDMKMYARSLMWEILIPPTERVRVIDVKVKKAGFTKLFGSERIDSIYQHLLEFQRDKQKQKAALGSAYSLVWDVPIESKKSLVRSWGKQFDARIATTTKTVRNG